MDVRVVRVSASATWELRRAVLRPGRTVAEMALPDDDLPPSVTFAAVDPGEEVVGCVRVSTDAPPEGLTAPGPEPAQPWRLRGMATRKDVRNVGIGSQVLARAVEYVAGQGGGLLWCNARTPALGLYRRAGFAEYGEVWEEPEIGPHIVMWKMVARAPEPDL